VHFECVVNLSEGRDPDVLAALDAAAGPRLADRHSDPDHHRSVYTLLGSASEVTGAARTLARAAVDTLDLRSHEGVHPRFGVLDVVPFVPFFPDDPEPSETAGMSDAAALRDDFAHWVGSELGVPGFLYGPLPDGTVRTLPDLRRSAFRDLPPDTGPSAPHPTAGACAVGVRPVLVAYNIWVSTVEVARQVATLVRSSAVRSLGLAVGRWGQVSCNLVDPYRVGPEQVYDAVTTAVEQAGGTVFGGELVGLLPAAVLAEIPRARWAEVGLYEEATIEGRLASPAV
jgi:glutamate formiminotransferase